MEVNQYFFSCNKQYDSLLPCGQCYGDNWAHWLHTSKVLSTNMSWVLLTSLWRRYEGTLTSLSMYLKEDFCFVSALVNTKHSSNVQPSPCHCYRLAHCIRVEKLKFAREISSGAEEEIAIHGRCLKCISKHYFGIWEAKKTVRTLYQ